MERAAELGGVWPEYNRHGDVVERYWGRLDEEFPAFQFAVYDEERDRVVAEGRTVPFRWDGTREGLPGGVDGVLEAAFALVAGGGRPDALSALVAVVAPEEQGAGVSGLVLAAMADIARGHRLGALVAPVRPSWKERYPLVPIERYASWRREDGLPFDPWIRVHARLGAELLRPEPRSLRISGTVADWETWTGMPFPESGSYVFPHGLAPVEIDVEADRGLYHEPNVWMRHPLTPSSEGG